METASFAGELDALEVAVLALPDDAVGVLALADFARFDRRLGLHREVELELRLAVFDRDARDGAGDRLVVVGNGLHVFADEIGRAGDVLTQQHGIERGGELVGGADLADLVDLVEHLRVVHRIERILILHFVDEQLQEHVEVQIVERVVLAELLAAGLLRIQERWDLRHVWTRFAVGLAEADLCDDVDAGVGDGTGNGLRLVGDWRRGVATRGAVRCGRALVLLAAAVLRGRVLLAAAGVAADIDVEALDLDVLLGEPLAEGGQIVEQQLARGGVVGFDRGGERTLVHRELEPHRAEFGRTESQLKRSAAFLGGVNCAGDAADKAGRVDVVRGFA